MTKFAHEKSKRRDIVRERGADPIWASIRKDDEFIRDKMKVQSSGSKKYYESEFVGRRPSIDDPVGIRSTAFERTSKVGSSTMRQEGAKRTEDTASKPEHVMSRREFAESPVGMGLRNRALKRAFRNYLDSLVAGAGSLEPNGVRVLSRKEFGESPAGAGLRNRALKRAHANYRKDLSGGVLSKETKEEYIKRIVNTTNSFPKETMADSESRAIIKKMRSEKAAQLAIEANPMNLGGGWIGLLSDEARNIYTKLFFAHPDTRVSAVSRKSKDALEIEVVGFHKSFAEELRRAVIVFDSKRGGEPNISGKDSRATDES